MAYPPGLYKVSIFKHPEKVVLIRPLPSGRNHSTVQASQDFTAVAEHGFDVALLEASNWEQKEVIQVMQIHLIPGILSVMWDGRHCRHQKL